MLFHEDGDTSWRARIDNVRTAVIDKKGDSFDARVVGGDPGAQHVGTAPTLEAAKLLFDGTVQADAQDPAKTAAARDEKARADERERAEAEARAREARARSDAVDTRRATAHGGERRES